MKAIALIVAIGVGIIALLFFEGFTISCLWEWFVTPLGVRSISIAQAIGLAIFARMMGLNSYDKNEDAAEQLAITVSMTIFVLVSGFVLNYFFM